MLIVPMAHLGIWGRKLLLQVEMIYMTMDAQTAPIKDTQMNSITASGNMIVNLGTHAQLSKTTKEFA